MLQPTLVTLYVADPAKSAAFYSRLLGISPVECNPTFSLFVLESGLRLGFKCKETAEPVPVIAGGGELGFQTHDVASLHDLHEKWCRLGLSIVQPPISLHWGHTFVALDVDGHRLRVFVPVEIEEGTR